MALRADEVAAVVNEIAPLLAGGRLDRIHHPTEDRVVLSFSAVAPIREAAERRLLLCFHRRHARLHLATRVPPNPETPSTFCMTLRRHLLNARLEAVEAVEGERVATLVFRSLDESQSPRRLRLVAELFGRGGNLLLVDETYTLLAVLRPSPSRTGARSLLPGCPYVPAPRPVVPKRSEAEREPCHPRVDPAEEAPLSRAIERRDSEVEDREAFEERKAAARREALKRLEPALRKSRKLEEELVRFERPERFLEEGELLKANLTLLGGAGARGLTEAVVSNYYAPDAPLVTLSLDPTLTVRENMERAFKRYHKAQLGRDKIRRHIEHTRAAADSARRFLEAVGASMSLPEVEAAEAAFGLPRRPAPRTKRERAVPKVEPGIRRFVSADGLEILVGKGDAENDHLTFRLAKGNDLWLHVRDYPGSHVVVRTPRLKSVPLETLLDAAHLAGFFSAVKARPVFEVSYTPRKNVHRVGGAKPGLVTLATHKSIRIQVERARLDRLLGRDHPAE